MLGARSLSRSIPSCYSMCLPCTDIDFVEELLRWRLDELLRIVVRLACGADQIWDMGY